MKQLFISNCTTKISTDIFQIKIFRVSGSSAMLHPTLKLCERISEEDQLVKELVKILKHRDVLLVTKI